MNVILNQWSEWECWAYAVLNCLEVMRPELDIEKILIEMRPDFGKMITHIHAGNWLKKRGYIKDFVPYRYNQLLADKIPVVVRLHGVNWIETQKPPYRLTMWWTGIWAHYVCITKGKAENSWGEAFWDHGFFYFSPEDVKNFSMIRRIIL